MLMEEFLDSIPRGYFYKHLTLSATACWPVELTLLLTGGQQLYNQA